MAKPKERFIKTNEGYDKILLTKEEVKTLTPIYSLFLKHTDNMYCIDVDIPEIKNVDDLIYMISQKIDNSCSISNLHFKNFKKILKNSVWVKGNTKGIHIYSKFENVPIYTDQIDVYKHFTGDFIKNQNNMWESIDKELNNYNGEILSVNDWNDISSMFNNKITHDIINEPKNKKVKETTLIQERQKSKLAAGELRYSEREH